MTNSAKLASKAELTGKNFNFNNTYSLDKNINFNNIYILNNKIFNFNKCCQIYNFK